MDEATLSQAVRSLLWMKQRFMLYLCCTVGRTVIVIVIRSATHFGKSGLRKENVQTNLRFIMWSKEGAEDMISQH